MTGPKLFLSVAVPTARRLVCLCVAFGVTAVLAATVAVADERKFSQQPELMPIAGRAAPVATAKPETAPKPEAKPAEPATKLATSAADAGPQPVWIWGASHTQKYVLRKKFTGTFKEGTLKVACDNSATVFVNGTKAVTNTEWNEASTADVSKLLKEGENELLAEVANQGGPAGFLAQLVVKDAAGKATFVVSDTTWEAAESKTAEKWVAVKKEANLGDSPWGNPLTGERKAKSGGGGGGSNAEFLALDGFQIEKLYTVPKDTLGSWVNLTVDPKGRLIVSDQGNKGLCRITPPKIGSNEPTQVEHLTVDISGAQGLLFAFGSLYVSVNGGKGSGLYRCRDTDGDDQFDEVVKLKDFKGGGEHGPHALLLSPDGKSIVCMCGNHTKPPFEPKDLSDTNRSRIPANWSEDHLLPRQWDANGHAAGILAPGGWIAKTDPEGKSWEVISMGYRNPFDMAFNAEGELFAYDADMEWDMGSPWYRPTRVSHATSGSEFGWRSGTGKWPAYYIDSLPAAVDIGPGSPVGVTFGYGAKFPAKYQKALYILDWTFGTIYAVHLQPHGSTYLATKEDFVARSPLPLTDAVVGLDGALYFTVGGRGTQSELFRVTYTGSESTAPVDAKDTQHADLRTLRRKLEATHEKADEQTGAQAVPMLIENLSHADRFIRYAARIGLEQRPVSLWQDEALKVRSNVGLITGVVGLARQADTSLQARLLSALDGIDFAKLPESEKLDLLRAYQLVFTRMGEPDEATRSRLVAKFDPFFPGDADYVNRELLIVLVYLKSHRAVKEGVAMLTKPTKHDAPEIASVIARNKGYGSSIASMLANHPDLTQVHFAFTLRNAKEGWTIDTRRVYFDWFEKARKWSGGNSYQGFLRNMERDLLEALPEKERLALETFGARKPYQAPVLPTPQGPGRDWTVADLIEKAGNGLKGRSFDTGKKMYAATRCVICHRFAGDGGATGPDLTQLAGRFTVKDLSESLIDPSKVVSDQYRATTVETKSGKVHTGRLILESDEKVVLITSPEDPTKTVEVKRGDVESLKPSTVSLMPKDLLKPLNEDEVLDLLAYLLSRGDKNHRVFKP